MKSASETRKIEDRRTRSPGDDTDGFGQCDKVSDEGEVADRRRESLDREGSRQNCLAKCRGWIEGEKYRR